MKLRVTHETTYRYTSSVVAAQHVAYLHPRAHPAQEVLDYALSIQPAGTSCLTDHDVFGNERAFLSMAMSHELLQVVSQSTVLTQALPYDHSAMRWEDAVESFRFRKGCDFDPAAEFVFASPLVPRHTELALYARESFGPGATLAEGARNLMSRIHRDFTYAAASTEISTPVLEAFVQRRGVCQDFAHILIGCLRALGLAARYVSGYVLTQPPPGQPRLIGADASHAWASVYLPDLQHLPWERRWLDLDPTNDRWGPCLPGADYVTLAFGRDFGDVSPLRGVIQGGGAHTLAVGVTVEPVN